MNLPAIRSITPADFTPDTVWWHYNFLEMAAARGDALLDSGVDVADVPGIDMMHLVDRDCCYDDLVVISTQAMHDEIAELTA